MGLAFLAPALIVSAGYLIASAKIALTLPPKTAIHFTTKSNTDVTMKTDGTVATNGPAEVKTEILVDPPSRTLAQEQVKQHYQNAGLSAFLGFAAYIFFVLIGWILSGFARSE